MPRSTVTQAEHEQSEVEGLRAQINELRLRFEGASEPEQVRELKERVRTVAKKYARTHDLCSVVDAALIEMGLGVTYKKVVMRAQVPVDVTVDINEDVLAAMSPEQQQAFIAERVAFKVAGSAATSDVRRVSVVVDKVIAAGEVHEPEGAELRNEPPPNYNALYTSSEGRVLHFVPEQRAMRGGQPLCGAPFGYSWTPHSSRGENRTCAECIAVAQRRNLYTPIPQ